MQSARWMDLGLAAVIASALAVAVWLVPGAEGVRTPAGDTPPGTCWVHETTGVDCPTCGMTRSYVACVHGDLAGSVGWHPAGPLTVAASILALLAVVLRWARRQSPLWGRPRFRAGLTALALFTLFAGFLRHLF